jgi:hypothetical protein
MVFVGPGKILSRRILTRRFADKETDQREG